MQRARLTVPVRRLAGILSVTVVLLAGCSDPAPTDVPAPAATTATVTAPSASASPTAAATPTPAPSATGAAPQPTASGDGTVEPSRPVETAAPKNLDEPTRTAGAEVSLVSVRATTIKATTPGDSSGPGVLVRLKMVNTTGRTLDTSFVQVNVDNDAGDPGTLVVGSPSDPVTGSVRASRSAQGTYAFLLSDVGSAAVTVSVYVTSGQPVVTFRGRAS